MGLNKSPIILKEKVELFSITTNSFIIMIFTISVVNFYKERKIQKTKQ